ncbi:hypothetical protein Hanom_Chr11g00968701 [Helianthus anomalus]
MLIVFFFFTDRFFSRTGFNPFEFSSFSSFKSLKSRLFETGISFFLSWRLLTPNNILANSASS